MAIEQGDFVTIADARIKLKSWVFPEIDALFWGEWELSWDDFVFVWGLT
jgi:hypothetical protein